MNQLVIPLEILWAGAAFLFVGVTGILARAAFLCAGKGVAAGRDFLVLLVIAMPIVALIVEVLKGAQ